MTAYRVAAGTQVHTDGVTYDAGRDIPTKASSTDVAFWLNAGWIEPKTAKTTRSG
jgi:hypothetical protein